MGTSRGLLRDDEPTFEALAGDVVPGLAGAQLARCLTAGLGRA